MRLRAFSFHLSCLLASDKIIACQNHYLVDRCRGTALSSAISIDQKSASRNPRSTVGTVTEVYDYLRLLYARIGVPHDPRPGSSSSARPPADRGPHSGHGRGHPVPSAGPGAARLQEHPHVVGQAGAAPGLERRLTDSVETVLRLANGVAEIEIVGPARPLCRQFTLDWDDLVPEGIASCDPCRSKGLWPSCPGARRTRARRTGRVRPRLSFDGPARAVGPRARPSLQWPTARPRSIKGEHHDLRLHPKTSTHCRAGGGASLS